jgi:hypothetical protein
VPATATAAATATTDISENNTPTPDDTATAVPSTSTPTPTHTIDLGTPTPRDPGCGLCPGDCNCDGRVTVDEEILGVNIALDLRPVEDCPEADINSDDRVTVDENVLASNAALNGCPNAMTATPIQPPVETATPVFSSTPTPPVATATAAATATQPPANTATPVFTSTPTRPIVLGTPTPRDPGCGDCPGDCNCDDRVTVDEEILGINIGLDLRPVEDCPEADVNDDDRVSVDENVLASNAALYGCESVGPNTTPTPRQPPDDTSTPTPTETPVPPPPTPTFDPCAGGKCPADINRDGTVTVDELVTAVNAALHGCEEVEP